MFRTKRARFLVLVSLLFVCRGGIANGQTLIPLWQFGGSSNDVDGGNSWSGLIQGRDGNFYGTTGGTGMVHCTVFKISPQGTLTTLWQFGSLSNDADGNTPATAGLVQGNDGNFYGTTSWGGTNKYLGTVYKITSAGTLTPLWQFGSLPNDADGIQPYAGLVQGSDGNFYGTTSEGGTNNPILEEGSGTVFKITPSGSLTPLWQFGSLSNNADGRNPLGPLVQGNDGNLYGTTADGGIYNEGSVFKITPSGALTPLWQFTGGTDGAEPIGALVQGSDGSFYGTTIDGGTNGFGTVFKITSAGTLTPLWQFYGLPNNADGSRPFGSLVQGSDGSFYGTTAYGGTNYGEYYYGGGTVFQITPSGTLTVAWQFSYAPPEEANGAGSVAGLVQGSDGSFYGVTSSDGTNYLGTIFKLTVPLNPPANQISSVSMAGTDIVFAVPSVAHETYQLQCSADLTSGIWSNICGAYVSNSIGALLTFTNFGGACSPQGFYRFDITP
jgi:uncharacterized repeat protein (TIGR03803 family)